MPTYTVDTAGATLSATSGADSVFIQTGAIGATSVFGLAGADTITIEGGVNNASAVGAYLHGGADADQFNLKSATFSAGNGTVIAGGGADTLILSGGSNLSVLKTGDGADSIRAVGAGSGVVSSLTMGANADNLTFSGTVTTLRLGNGHDLVSGSMVSVNTGGGIYLGDGRDTIVATLGGASAISLIGDSSAAAADVITLTGVTVKSSIKGAGGSDTITIGDSMGVSALIAGNAGSDSIVLSGIVSTGTTIGGGSGADTIAFAGTSFSGDTFHVKGGADADSINFAGNVLSGANSTGLQIQGGSGADSITFSDVHSGVAVGTLVYSSLSESNLDATDKVTLSATAPISGSIQFNFSNSAHLDTVGSLSGSVLFNSTTNKATMASGIVTFSGTKDVSSVTAAMETVDTLTLSYGEGSVARFKTKGGLQYLFMQGGTSGVTDVSLIQIAGVSRTKLSVTPDVKLTFSGALS